MYRKTLLRSVLLLAAFTLIVSSLLPAGTFHQTAHANTRVDNPYVGARAYVNPDYAAAIDRSIALTSNAQLKKKMETIKDYPTSIWLDRIAAIRPSSGKGVEAHLNQAINQLNQLPQGTPMTITFVIYNLPGRDCSALASGGELPNTAAGLERYKKEYIDPIASIFARERYNQLRIIAMIEPDSLPNMVTNVTSQYPACQEVDRLKTYEKGIQYALDKFAAIPNVYSYLDIAHSGWLGWDNNLGRAVTLYTDVVKGTAKGFDSVTGFVTNTSGYTPVEEPNLPNPNNVSGVGNVKSASFYEWNPHFDESDFTTALYNRFRTAGWPSRTGFTIDTSRNGWGGPNRPTAAVGSNPSAYVDSGRIDRRTHRYYWCNVDGAGMGHKPQAKPAGYGSHIHAFVWNKPPGESDGASKHIPNSEGKQADPNCDPNYVNPLYKVKTGAMANAPLAGQWFHEQFVMLVNNAYPPIPEKLDATVITKQNHFDKGKVSVEWTPVPGAQRYTLQFNFGRGWETFGTMSRQTSLAAHFADLELGELQYFRVIAENDQGASSTATFHTYTFYLDAIADGDRTHLSWNSVTPHHNTYYSVLVAPTSKGPWEVLPNNKMMSLRKATLEIPKDKPFVKVEAYVVVMQPGVKNPIYLTETNPVHAHSMDYVKFTKQSDGVRIDYDYINESFGSVHRFVEPKLMDASPHPSGSIPVTYDKHINPAKTYWYRFALRLDNGERFPLFYRYADPNAPGSFTASLQNTKTGEVNLSWTPSAKATKYIIYRKTDKKPWSSNTSVVKIGETSGTQFLDTYRGGSFAEYKIVAENSSGINIDYIDSYTIRH